MNFDLDMGERASLYSYLLINKGVIRNGMPASNLRLGVHVSISGGLEKAIYRARELGCTAMQMFSHNPRGWKVTPLLPQSIAAFRKATFPKEVDPIFIHTSYLLNLASGDERLHQKSVSALSLELIRAEELGARYIVTHLGSAKEKGRKFGLRRVIKALNQVLKRDSPVYVLLENSAGGGKSIGGTLEEMEEIIEGVKENHRIKVCFDTCHGFAAGYDFRTEEKTEALAKKINKTIGWEKLSLLHLNDCAHPLGSHLDRHYHIGEGKIGLRGFRILLHHPSFRNLPMILETPKTRPEDDRTNLSRVRKLFGENPVKKRNRSFGGIFPKGREKDGDIPISEGFP